MKPKSYTITFRLNSDGYENIKKAASSEERSVSGQVRWIVKQYIIRFGRNNMGKSKELDKEKIFRIKG